MHKIGVCGVFGNGERLLNGQTVKTKTLTDQLRLELNNDDVKTLDTWKWKKKPFSLLKDCFLLVRDCENIVLLPAHNGIKVFSFLFLVFNGLYKRKIHYVVIGGWLTELLKKDIGLKKRLSKFHKIYAETNYLAQSLKNLNLENVEVLPNFKDLKIIKEEDLNFQTVKPFKLCTFSKILEGKGIEDAIYAIKKINEKHEKVLCTLDIYGEIDSNYEEKFKLIIKEFPDFINYKGQVDYNESVYILKEYHLLLFPTRFKTEGHPGTIIDAFAAGLPVVASKWNSATEIIDEKSTGFLYEFSNRESLVAVLDNVLHDVKKVNAMKKECIKKAEEYSARNVIKNFTRNLI